MKGPSIAVMLAGKGKPDEDDAGEPGAGETEEGAKDAAKALMHAVASRDAEGVYRAFRSLCSLCRELDEHEDAGGAEEDDKSEHDDADE